MANTIGGTSGTADRRTLGSSEPAPDEAASRRTTPALPRLTYRPAECAGLLGVARSTRYQWLATDPSFPVIRCGRVTLIPHDGLLAWLAAQDRAGSHAA